MGSHDAYGKRVLLLATDGEVEQNGAAVEVDLGVGHACRIDGAVGKEIAVEVESRTAKQVRGAILDLICHPYPKKFLVLLPVHMSNPEIAAKQVENILSRFLGRDLFRVLLLHGSGDNPQEEQDVRLVAEALAELGYRAQTGETPKVGSYETQRPRISSLFKGKYAPLQEYLLQLPRSMPEATLSFKEIEEILGFSLPKSARTYREWWSNQTDLSNRPQAKAWINAGFRVESIRLHADESWVRLIRLT
ncbi:hypothetical protein GCM10007160_24300 [Litchfieldella qijiaojingensis]|uniref:DUF7662 domain-containing protein n=1 Tax=Litchfieldella qijiaojingensis TaxID=980347 RepID=A0ABQ2YUK3_9GAMM|nr:hypothetical protein [Halomonas qijiaojingensis]GGX95814.1 hypothetical protein GCM10007160_24300 [Halomonas qijiaojingensis]